MTEDVNQESQDAPQFEGFKGQPMKVINTGEVQETPEPQAVIETEPAPEQQAAEPEQTETPAEPEVPYWTRLAQQAGVQVEAEDDLVRYLQKTKELEAEYNTLKNKNPYEGLDPLAIDVDKATKAGLDVSLYMEARSMDVDQLEHKEALRRKFMLEDPGLVKKDPKLADRLFEGEYREKYGILSKQVNEDLLEPNELQEYKDKVELLKMSLDREVYKAKEWLNDWKSKNVTVPEPSRGGMSAEDAERIQQEYFQQATSFAESIETLDVEVGDEVFKFGLGDYRDQIKEDLMNPIETLKEIGVDLTNGSIDAETFGQFLAARYAVTSMGKPLSDWAIEKFNAKTVKAKINNPVAPTQSLTGGATPQKSHDEKLAEQVAARRMAARSVN